MNNKVSTTMKRLIAAVFAITLTTSAIAGGGHHRPPVVVQHHHSSSGQWVGPLIGGIILGTILSKPAESQPPVVVQQPPVIYSPGVEYYNCLVQVYDPVTKTTRNEVMTCVRR